MLNSVGVKGKGRVSEREKGRYNCNGLEVNNVEVKMKGEGFRKGKGERINEVEGVRGEGKIE